MHYYYHPQQLHCRKNSKFSETKLTKQNTFAYVIKSVFNLRFDFRFRHAFRWSFWSKFHLQEEKLRNPKTYSKHTQRKEMISKHKPFVLVVFAPLRFKSKHLFLEKLNWDSKMGWSTIVEFTKLLIDQVQINHPFSHLRNHFQLKQQRKKPNRCPNLVRFDLPSSVYIILIPVYTLNSCYFRLDLVLILKLNLSWVWLSLTHNLQYFLSLQLIIFFNPSN